MMRLHAQRFSTQGGYRLLIGLALVLALAFPAVAVAKKCPTPGHPSCDDGGGGGDDTTTTAQNTTALWSGRLTSEGRECSPTSINLKQGGVTNECVVGDLNPDVIVGPFTSDEILATGREPWLCGLLSENLVFGDSTNRIGSFWFSSHTEWNGTICLDENLTEPTTCRIHVQNWVHGNMCHSEEIASGECGGRLIILKGFGPATAAVAPELNPFTEPQDIVLNELTFLIKAIGKNRTEATCTIDFNSATQPEVTFSTVLRN